jgi:hypothetical protein
LELINQIGEFRFFSSGKDHISYPTEGKISEVSIHEPQ